jgi:ribonuclease D
MDEEFVARLDALKEWRKVTARKMGVESDVILPRDMMCRIAKKNPGSLAELRKVMADLPWRVEEFGQRILAVLVK